MNVLLVRIGIIITLIAGYLFAKNLDNMSGNMMKMYGGGVVIGIVLFIAGMSISKENYDLMSNRVTEYYYKFNNKLTEYFTFQPSGNQKDCGSPELVGGTRGFPMNRDNWPNRPDVPIFTNDKKERFRENNNDLESEFRKLQVVFYHMDGCGFCEASKTMLIENNLYREPTKQEVEKGIIPDTPVKLKDSSEVSQLPDNIKSEIDGFPAWYSPVTGKFTMGKMELQDILQQLSGPAQQAQPVERYPDSLVNQINDMGLVLFSAEGCPHCDRAKDNIEKYGLTNSIKILPANAVERYPEIKSEARGFPAWTSEKYGGIILGNKPIDKVVTELYKERADNKKKGKKGNKNKNKDKKEDKTEFPQDKIILFLMPGCGFCDAAQQHVESNGLENMVMMYPSDQASNLPQPIQEQVSGFPLWYYNGQIQQGFNEDRLNFPMIAEKLNFKGKQQEDSLQDLLRENYEPQYHKYSDLANVKSSNKSENCNSKENYESDCPYRNPSGRVPIENVG